MKDFISAALSWVCVGVTVALCAANHSAQKRGAAPENRMAEGMSIGLCAGMLIGSQYVGCGLLAGALVGRYIRKGKSA